MAMIGGRSENQVPYTLTSLRAVCRAAIRFSAKAGSPSTFSSYSSRYVQASKDVSAAAGASTLAYSRPTAAQSTAISTRITARRVFEERILISPSEKFTSKKPLFCRTQKAVVPLCFRSDSATYSFWELTVVYIFCIRPASVPFGKTPRFGVRPFPPCLPRHFPGYSCPNAPLS